MNSAEPDSNPLQTGERLTVTIETLATGGDGIARPGGFTLFIPYTAPGDVAEVEITEITKSYGRARVRSITQPGPDRIPTTCPLAGQCPGCALQHLRYEAQLMAKQRFVQDGLERIGHLKGIEVRPTLGMDNPWQYRNKGEFIAEQRDGRVQLGYHGEESGEFLPLPDCPIHHPLSMAIVRATEEVATADDLPLAQLITRVSPSEGKALAILVCWDWSDRLPAAAEALQTRVPGLTGVLWSRVRGRSVVRRTPAEPLTGAGKLLQKLDRWDYVVSAESFFQVNNIQAARMIEIAREFAGDMADAIFVDAYCGVGTFLLPLASQALRAIGIEENSVALRDAGDNLARYALHDVKLYEGRVDVVFQRQLRKGRSVDVALLDPPRKGAGRAVLNQLSILGAERVILVSCDPATLGRDAGDLAAFGYTIQTVQPVDMFPQTWHVESIALATR